MHPFLTAFLAQTSGNGAGGLGGLSMQVMLALMFAVFYFVLWRPQAKEKKKHQDMIQKVQKGHEVITQAGFYAKVLQVEDQAVVLDLGGGKVRMLRPYIVRNLTLEEEDRKSREQAKGAKAEAKK
jgi:preprotein translocase subunit YajC